MRCLFSLKRMVFTPFCRKCLAYYDGVVVVVVWLVKKPHCSGKISFAWSARRGGSKMPSVKLNTLTDNSAVFTLCVWLACSFVWALFVWSVLWASRFSIIEFTLHCSCMRICLFEVVCVWSLMIEEDDNKNRWKESLV